MKFSTILADDGGFRLIPGAKFVLEPGAPYQLPRIANGRRYEREALNPRYNSVLASNELVTGAGVFVSHHIEYGYEGRYPESRYQITIQKAAVRVGEPSIIVTEAEASHCEGQHQAHALWIPDSSIKASFEARKGGKLLMNNLAVLTQDDILSLKTIRHGVKDSGIFKMGEPFSEVTWEGRFAFDGTNIQFLNGEFLRFSQDAYV